MGLRATVTEGYRGMGRVEKGRVDRDGDEGSVSVIRQRLTDPLRDPSTGCLRVPPVDATGPGVRRLRPGAKGGGPCGGGRGVWW